MSLSIRLFNLFLFCTVTAFSLPSATEMVKTGEEIMRGETSQLIMTMSIQRPSYTRNLKVRSWTSGKDKSMVEILEPLKEEGVTSLRVKSDMWNYLPKTDQVVKVPTSLMLQSWMGSDFTNDDLMKLSQLAIDYTHKIIKTEKINYEELVLIECTPKPNAPVVWGKILYWARKKDNLPVKEEYFDEKNKLVRTMTLSEFKKMDDRVIPTTITITKANANQENTTIKYEKVLYNRNIPDSLFLRDSLRRNSQQGKNLEAGWES